MFDDVFDEKQWKKARDAAGLKGALTEKVSMGDEFKRFQQNKTLRAAKVLLEKITLYEKQLKTKHTKDKYYTKLLKVVQEQKAAIEAGIEALENPPTETTASSMDDKAMDELVDEIIEREKEHAREYEDPNNDPNTPIYGEARRVYLKLTKQFKTIEGQIKGERAAVTDLLQKCKALEANPNLRQKPDSAIAVAQKIVETLNKIEGKATDLHSDFGIEGQAVRKQLGGEAGATKALDALLVSLTREVEEIAGTSRECRLALKNALQALGGNPQAEEIVRRLHV